MRKFPDMFIVCIWLMFVMVTCALVMDQLDPIQRVALLVTAAVVGCVFIWCESRIAHTVELKNMLDRVTTEKTKPPEAAEE